MADPVVQEELSRLTQVLAGQMIVLTERMAALEAVTSDAVEHIQELERYLVNHPIPEDSPDQ